jgi:hypothetical protein
VAQACNFSYSGGGDWEDHGLRPAQTKSYGETAFQQSNVVSFAVVPVFGWLATWQAVGRKTMVQAKM